MPFSICEGNLAKAVLANFSSNYPSFQNFLVAAVSAFMFSLGTVNQILHPDYYGIGTLGDDYLHLAQ